MYFAVKHRLRERLARMEEQLIALLAAEILLALYDPRDTGRQCVLGPVF